MVEYSFGLLKPDCTEKKLELDVLSMIEAAGLRVCAMKRLRISQEQIDELYQRHIGKEFYPYLSAFLMSNEVVAYVVEGQKAIELLNELVGGSDPRKARPGTIRNTFGESITRNVTHSSYEVSDFIRESRIFFSNEELSVITAQWEVEI